MASQEPRIGIFVCHCGINIGGVVKVPEVVEYARTLKGVAFVEENLYTCSQDTQEKIKKAIQEHRLNRVVVASCSPRTHEPLFQETIREVGLNKYLFEMTNIRDQCSWVHMHQPEEATQKAKELLQMIVAKSAKLRPLKEPVSEVKRRGLVLGGGLSGMRAALGLAQQGFECALVETEKELGGNLRKIYYTLEGNDVQDFLQETVKEVLANPRIQVFTNTQVKQINGYIGNFTTLLSVDGTEKEYEHGVVIVAVGGKESAPNEYLYGQDRRVLTQRELEEKIVHHPEEIETSKRVVMIQCVGSRTPERPYCSRICCSLAVKNALKIKEKNPGAEVTILYRDIRTFGLMERFYTEARKQGISFIPYDLDSKPDLRVEDRSSPSEGERQDPWRGGHSQAGPRCSGKRHCPLRKRSVGEDAQSPFEFERFLPRGSHEVEARRFRNRWHLPGWIVALSEGHQRMHCSGGRGCGPGNSRHCQGLCHCPSDHL